ncbi:MAG: GNAT family N-acetyltransferase [Sedimentisphaerales bacterium]|nr:GNAT family N-acetyltransferase [Sedimentisphaerales bacterium]
MASAASIRSYRASDRPAVREIACDTADAGEPVERLFHDREVFADIVTRYYTDYEPNSLWVADCDGQVVGYLTGCLDTRNEKRVTGRRILPSAITGALARGVLWHADAWRLLAAFAGTVALGGFPHPIDLTAYPAHLHINIRQGFRSRGLGPQLVDAFLQQADHVGVRGIHVVTRGDNAAGRRFFEKTGFRLLFEKPLVLPAKAWFRRTSTAVYGRSREA